MTDICARVPTSTCVTFGETRSDTGGIRYVDSSWKVDSRKLPGRRRRARYLRLHDGKFVQAISPRPPKDPPRCDRVLRDSEPRVHSSRGRAAPLLSSPSRLAPLDFIYSTTQPYSCTNTLQYDDERCSLVIMLHHVYHPVFNTPLLSYCPINIITIIAFRISSVRV